MKQSKLLKWNKMNSYNITLEKKIIITIISKEIILWTSCVCTLWLIQLLPNQLNLGVWNSKIFRRSRESVRIK